ncbi:MAG: hypothetical protein PQJ59_01790 [Spirochaetales bacterium]|nr:hypothetical protein [Spirochaetales bacterium]
MKVRLKKNGKVVEMTDAMGKLYIKKGTAEEVKDTKPAPKKEEPKK